MNYKPQCDSCKYFITTDKTPKEVKRNRYKPRWFHSILERNGRCTLGYCNKEKKRVYRKNMR
jgi:arginyl-tRNA--protein-N-Asp/Glu arginylyltransferase